MNKRLSSGRVALFTAILLIIVTGISVLYSFVISSAGQMSRLTDWKYFSSDRISRLNTIVEADMIPSDEDGTVYSDKQYVALKGVIPDTDFDTLCILTNHNKLRVSIDGNVIYDTLTNTRGIFEKKINRIHIDPTYKGKSVDIIAQGAASLKFEAYLTNEGANSLLLGRPFEDAMIFAVALALMAFVAGIYGSIKKQSRDTVILFVLSFVFSAISVVFSTDILSSNASELLLSAKISISSMILASACALIAPISNVISGENIKEKYFVLNSGYILALLLWPYEVFFESVIRFVFVLEIINAIYVFYHLRYRRINPKENAVAATIVFGIFNLLYWSIPSYSPYARFLSVGICVGLIVMYPSTVVGLAVRVTTGTKIIKHIHAKRVKNENLLSNAREENNRATVITAARASAQIAQARVFERASERIGLQSIVERLVKEDNNDITHHMFIVSEYVRVLCSKFGLDTRTIEDYSDAALFHDMGKLCVPSDILDKEEGLSEEEFAIIRKHNRLGYDIIYDKNDPFRQLAARVALEHHEHYDGSGYLGMKDDELSIASKFTAVADVFSALTAPRKYKREWSFDEAFNYIIEHSGNDFNPAVVELFKNSRNEISNIYIKYQISLIDDQMHA